MRAVLAVASITLAAFAWQSASTIAQAAEAQARPAAIPPTTLVAERLAKDGYEVVGEPVRKGDLVVLSATRTGLTWRLVIDPRTGGIIGQRPLGSPLPFQP